MSGVVGVWLPGRAVGDTDHWSQVSCEIRRGAHAISGQLGADKRSVI